MKYYLILLCIMVYICIFTINNRFNVNYRTKDPRKVEFSPEHSEYQFSYDPVEFLDQPEENLVVDFSTDPVGFVDHSAEVTVTSMQLENYGIQQDQQIIHTVPETVRNIVNGTRTWQYASGQRDNQQTNMPVMVHNNVWLDTREKVMHTPCLWLNLLIHKEVRTVELSQTNTAHHLGYITFNNTVYKLTGQTAHYIGRRCRNKIVMCRHVVYFKLPFNVSYDDYALLLHWKFVYVNQIVQSKPIQLEIQIPEKPDQKKGDFFLCTKPLFGSFSDRKVKELVEWVEMNRILGIDKIEMYNLSLQNTPAFKKFFSYYEKGKYLTLRQEDNPVKNLDFAEWLQSDFSQLSSLSNCFFRNMHQYDYVVVLDIDELIIPVRYATLDELFRKHIHPNFRQYGPVLSYSSAFVFLYDTDKTNLTEPGEFTSKVISYSRFYKLTESGSAMRRGKSVTSSATCPYPGQHMCYVSNEGYNTRLELPYDVSGVHHYRDECKKSSFCRPELKSVGLNYTQRYKTQLLRALEDSHSILGF